jgi:2',3'-cyclic-nucleotide 2'-phosphodiesterase (5'-nucleotidase family)
MGYHAVGIGDDDFNLGKKFLIELSKTSHVTFLSSNVIDEESGKTLFQRHVMKEANGLKIGIFSLLSPDAFLGPSDTRKKGLIIRDPVETARDIIRELGPKTDLIILLSHQGYPKDVELAQQVSGVQVIVGGHTGIDLNNPPVIKNTIIVQNAPKGMYAKKLNLTLSNKEATFYNMATKNAYGRNLTKLRQQLSSTQASGAERNQWQRAAENIERTLQQLEQKNPFTFESFSLGEAVKDLPDIKKMIDNYKLEFPEKSEPPMHDSRGSYTPKPVESK